VATVVLRGSTEAFLDDVERAVDDGVNAFKALAKDSRAVPAGGASEIEIARVVGSHLQLGRAARFALARFGGAWQAGGRAARQRPRRRSCWRVADALPLPVQVADFGRKQTGLDQYAIGKFAEAFEVVPRMLAENSGLNATDVVCGVARPALVPACCSACHACAAYLRPPPPSPPRLPDASLQPAKHPAGARVAARALSPRPGWVARPPQVSALYAAHSSGQLNAGLDLETGEPADLSAAGISDVYSTKWCAAACLALLPARGPVCPGSQRRLADPRAGQAGWRRCSCGGAPACLAPASTQPAATRPWRCRWAIKLATDAVATVLKVDQIIMAKQAGGPKPRGMDGDDD
jgi:hypothetical protein